jgi:hypothetical protein
MPANDPHRHHRRRLQLIFLKPWRAPAPREENATRLHSPVRPLIPEGLNGHGFQ